MLRENGKLFIPQSDSRPISFPSFQLATSLSFLFPRAFRREFDQWFRSGWIGGKHECPCIAALGLLPWFWLFLRGCTFGIPQFWSAKLLRSFLWQTESYFFDGGLGWCFWVTARYQKSLLAFYSFDHALIKASLLKPFAVLDSLRILDYRAHSSWQFFHCILA